MATKRLFRNGDERLSRPPASTPQSRLSVPGWAWSLTKGLAQPLGQRGRLALAAALAIVALVAGLTGLRDPDTFHLLAVGRDIVRHRGFPTEDPFLYPLAGMPAGASASWLSAVAIYLSHVALGESGPVLLAGFLLGALLLVPALDAVDAKATAIEALAALVPLLLALWVLRWRSVARPEMFANVLLAITLFVLRRHYEGKATPLLWLLPLLAAVWSNLHQSAVAGIGVVLVYGAVGAAQLLMAKLAEWRREWAPETKTVRLAVATAGLMIGASLLNPSMTTSITTALAFVGNQIGLHLPAAEPLTRVLPFMKVGVEELRPLSAMDWVGPFGILVVLTAASFAVGFRAASPPDIAISAAFVVMALSAQRFAGVGALVLAPIAARNFAVGLSRVPTRSRAVARVVAGVTALGACVAAIVLLAGMDVGFGLGFRPDNFPVRAAQYLESIGFTGRLYNTFDFGGYLEWKLDRKFFQDGRLGLLAGDEQAAFTDTGHYGAFAALDERYRFDALVVAYPQFPPHMVAVMEESSADRDWVAADDVWSLVAFDQGGLLYLRRDGAYGRFAAQDEYRYARPANSFPALRLRDYAFARGFVQDMERAVTESPGCRSCRWRLGLALLLTGTRERAERVVAADMLAPIYVRLGDVLFDFGNVAGALEAYRHAIEIDPVLAEAQFGVAEVLDGEHDTRAAEAYRSYLLPRHRDRTTWIRGHLARPDTAP